jgi:hypothetical protein
MGIKAIKEKYKIEHIVQKEGDTICIGSPYMHDIICLNAEGRLTKMYKNREYDDGWSTNEDLKRYQEEMLIDQESGELKRLINLNDDVNELITVFTYNGGRVVKKYCEVYGWPNTTIDGELMYDNTFFKTYKEAYIALLKETSLKYSWRIWKRNISDAFGKIKSATGYLLRDIFEYLYSRIVQRVKGVFCN